MGMSIYVHDFLEPGLLLLQPAHAMQPGCAPCLLSQTAGRKRHKEKCSPTAACTIDARGMGQNQKPSQQCCCST